MLFTHLVDLPQVVYVNITKDSMKVPLQAARRNDNTFLLKFRPMIEGDHLILLKNYLGQPILGKPRTVLAADHLRLLDCPYVFPVYNPDAVQLEPFNVFQPINKCHFICEPSAAYPS